MFAEMSSFENLERPGSRCLSEEKNCGFPFVTALLICPPKVALSTEAYSGNACLYVERKFGSGFKVVFGVVGCVIILLI